VRAMLLTAQQRPLEARDIQPPNPREGQVLVEVHACGVCRTDLHVVDRELANPKLPLVPGHEVVGTVILCSDATRSMKFATAPPCPAVLRKADTASSTLSMCREHLGKRWLGHPSRTYCAETRPKRVPCLLPMLLPTAGGGFPPRQLSY
jgi:threonine dehydrogenase-like Zn-dependent dehydrogenase